MRDGTVEVVLVDVVAWTALSVVVGYAGHRLPASALAHDTWVTRIRPGEADGRRWERLGVRRWKDVLPEAGGFFGGVSKRTLGGRAGLERQVVETRRAELVHWTLAGCGPLFFAWNPRRLAASMVVFGLVFNAPFIVIQRFNRARLLRALVRAAAATTPPGARTATDRATATEACR